MAVTLDVLVGTEDRDTEDVIDGDAVLLLLTGGDTVSVAPAEADGTVEIVLTGVAEGHDVCDPVEETVSVVVCEEEAVTQLVEDFAAVA